MRLGVLDVNAGGRTIIKGKIDAPNGRRRQRGRVMRTTDKEEGRRGADGCATKERGFSFLRVSPKGAQTEQTPRNTV